MTLAQAADYLQVSKRTISSLINKGELVGRRTGGNSGKYLVMKSACVEYLSNPPHPSVEYLSNPPQNRNARVGDQTKGKPICQSPSEAEYGTVISLPRMAKELGDRLGQRTKSKHRSCTTD
ncbi:MAG: helix-turn-helix domain-containing protein [Symbiopectobacterium sp.]